MVSLTLPAHHQSGLSANQKAMLYGFGAVAIWGSNLALARAGVTHGLTGMDFALFRFLTAGLVMLPWLLLNQPKSLAGVGWGRGAVLAILAGPLFILLGIGGYKFSPLAHGAVMQPASIIIVSTLLAALILNDRPKSERVLGITTMLMGLAIIAGPALFQGAATTPVGDLMFVAAGSLWAGFTILARRWNIKALPATAAVSVISGAIILPIYLLTQDLAHLALIPWFTIGTQSLVQGVMSGVVAVIFSSRAAELGGAARASTYLALVPAAAIVIGIPITGELPTLVQLGGLVFVSLGLLISLGAINFNLKGK